MTPEEYERIKQAEKEHLRKLKKLKEAHRQLERQQKLTRAVTDMTSSMQEKLDVHADMMDRIVTESALNEARLEMALEASELKNEATKSLEDELALTKAKARELIRQMKSEQGGEVQGKQEDAAPSSGGEKKVQTTSQTEVSKTRESTSTAPKSPRESGENLPEKTIGRMKH